MFWRFGSCVRCIDVCVGDKTFSYASCYLSSEIVNWQRKNDSKLIILKNDN